MSSALKAKGISKVWEMITDYQAKTQGNGYFKQHRTEQNTYWLMQTIEDRLKQDFFNTPHIKAALQNQIQKIESGETTPFAAADYLLDL